MTNSARDHILSGIRRRLGRTGAPAGRPAPHPIPARATALDHAGRVDLFVAMAAEVAATVARVDGWHDVPRAIGEFLDGHGLARRLRFAPALAGLDWTGFDAAPGKAEPADLVSVTPAIAAVAETGTLVLRSGPDSPTSLNFLPDNHIVAVSTADVVATYEEVWERLRAQGPLPRTVNMITGPSRTGDIEQTIQLGAHGPRRLHVILADGRLGA